MKVATWNVNSVNKRREHIIDFLQKNDPDILLLQETKCNDYVFNKKSFKDIGYFSYHLGQDNGFNGVAILSKKELSDIRVNFDGLEIFSKEELSAMKEKSIAAGRKDFEFEFTQSRLIQGTTEDNIKIVCVYCPYGTYGGEPHGNEYKEAFLKTFLKYLSRLSDQKVIVGGDSNVVLRSIDAYFPEGLISSTPFFDVKFKTLFRKIINAGYVDLLPLFKFDQQIFTWWDYKNSCWELGKGLQIDRILASNSMVDYSKGVDVFSEYRGMESPSDHVPVMAYFDEV